MICNGIKVQTCNQHCNAIAVKSSHQDSWCMTYKESRLSRAKKYDIGIDQNEMLVLSHQSVSGIAEIVIEPVGMPGGTILLQGGTMNSRTLRVGEKYRYTIPWGKSLIFRTSEMRAPDGTKVRVA